MNTHLSQEELILSYYGEPELGSRRAHLESCDECGAELRKLADVLDRVTPVEVPEPDEQYETRVWQRLSWRLPRRAERRHTWLAAAAAIALALIGALLWSRRTADDVTRPAPVPTASASTEIQRDRILLVVVGDHFDESERMLVELTNLTPAGEVDISSEQERAEELLASNRLYRSTATERGEEELATLLDELEPVLMQIAHAPSQVTPDELRRIQKRVEAKGLVFKLRVVRADVRATALPHIAPTI